MSGVCGYEFRLNSRIITNVLICMYIAVQMYMYKYVYLALHSGQFVQCSDGTARHSIVHGIHPCHMTRAITTYTHTHTHTQIVYDVHCMYTHVHACTLYM